MYGSGRWLVRMVVGLRKMVSKGDCMDKKKMVSKDGFRAKGDG